MTDTQLLQWKIRTNLKAHAGLLDNTKSFEPHRLTTCDGFDAFISTGCAFNLAVNKCHARGGTREALAGPRADLRRGLQRREVPSATTSERGVTALVTGPATVIFRAVGRAHRVGPVYARPKSAYVLGSVYYGTRHHCLSFSLGQSNKSFLFSLVYQINNHLN